MAINKVIIDGTTVLDLTGKTVSPAAMASGVTALDSTGADIVGTAVSQAEGEVSGSNHLVRYVVRDDVVNLYSPGITYSSLTLPSSLAPGHDVYWPCAVTDSNGNEYGNGAILKITAAGAMSFSGISGTRKFCLSYIRGAT